MRERPISLRDWEARAILEGRKTQTRRPVQSPAKNMQREGMEVIKRRAPGDRWYGDHVWSMRGPTGVWGDYTDDRFRSLCPFGAPGDLLWVREAHAFDPCEDSEGNAADRVLYRADHNGAAPLRWRPSIHMPRWASRLTLRVADVRVERVQDITEEDARSEGVYSLCGGYCAGGADAEWNATARAAFEGLWIDTYGPESWTANPFCWVVSFERAEVRR